MYVLLLDDLAPVHNVHTLAWRLDELAIEVVDALGFSILPED